MKNKLLLIASLLMLALPSNAIVSSSYDIDTEDLSNRGYSKQMIDIIEVKSTQAKGQVPPIIEESDTSYKFRWVKKFFKYVDPSIDNNTDFLYHNINPSPSVNDL